MQPSIKNLAQRLTAGFFMFFSLKSYGELQILKIGADKWCPFTCEEELGYDGFTIDLLREGLRICGYGTKYMTSSFSRATIQVESGEQEIHAATDKNFTPTLLIGQEAVAASKWVFVSKKQADWTYKGISSIRGKRFGAVNVYIYSKEITDYYLKPENKKLISTISSTSPQEQLLKMLDLDRIDFIIEDESVINYWVKKLGMEGKIKLSGVDSETLFYPAYKNGDKESSRLKESIDACLGKTKKNKKFMNNLKKKYDVQSIHLP